MLKDKPTLEDWDALGDMYANMNWKGLRAICKSLKCERILSSMVDKYLQGHPLEVLKKRIGIAGEVKHTLKEIALDLGLSKIYVKEQEAKAILMLKIQRREWYHLARTYREWLSAKTR